MTTSQGRLDVGVTFNPKKMTLKLVVTDHEKEVVKRVVERYHSYRAVQASLSRRVDFLVMSGDMVGGAIGFSDQQTMMLPILKKQWLSLMSIDELREGIIYVIDNYRFTMIERGIGSKALGMAVRALPKVWQDRFETPVACVTTAVKPPWTGTVYKAAGWDVIGMTTGNKGFRYRARDGQLYEPIYSGEKLILFGKWIHGYNAVKLRELIGLYSHADVVRLIENAVNPVGSDNLDGAEEKEGEKQWWKRHASSS